MNGNGTAMVAEQARSVGTRVVEDSLPILDTGRFEHMYRIAKAIARATLTPKHLQGKTIEETTNNCFRVVNQAVRWGMDPFSVIDETYVVHNRLRYQGKLVAAVINARAGLQKRLEFEYTGTGKDLTVTVIGLFTGETKPRTITLSVEQAMTDNDMWNKDPEQKLAYSGATKWARRHAPEVMLGVLTDDDLERMSESTQAARPKQSIDELVASKVAEQAPAAIAAPVEPPNEEPKPADKAPDLAPGESVDAGGEIHTAHDWRTDTIEKHALTLGVKFVSRFKALKLVTLGDLQKAIEAGTTKMDNSDLERVGDILAEISVAAEAG